MTEKENGGAVPPLIAPMGASTEPGHRDRFAAIMESVTQRVASSAKGTGLTGAPFWRPSRKWWPTPLETPLRRART